ncbi:MAG: RluA family pseudouridine synthase [Spirochaetales bacterium]|nr:RluA family pseudouridine synthase [Spirochaetales bacterium]
MNYKKHIVSRLPEIDMRIDKYIAEELKLFSRSQVKTRIKKILVNGKETRPGKKVNPNDILEIFYSDPPPVELVPEKIDLSILFENEEVIVINKSRGMVVHPGCGNRTGTLVNALLYYCEQIKNNFENTELRPGIVHRLDKDTSGVIIIAKNLKSHGFLSRQFAKSRVKKIYLAVVRGEPPEQFGIIDTHIMRDTHDRKKFKTGEAGGKRAITFYKLIKSGNNYSFLLLRPKTGRTHQLRVHLKYIHCPIAGDPLYSRKDKQFPDTPLMLHAFKLRIRLPGQKEVSLFKAPLPGDFKRFIKQTGLSGEHDR